MNERAYPVTATDWLDFSQRLYRAAYLIQRKRRGRWAKNVARAAEMAAEHAASLHTSPSQQGEKP